MQSESLDIERVAKIRIKRQNEQIQQTIQELGSCKQSVCFAAEIFFEHKLIKNKSIPQIYDILIEMGKQRYKAIPLNNTQAPYKKIKKIWQERAVYLQLYKFLLSQLQNLKGMTDEELKEYDKKLQKEQLSKYRKISKQIHKEKTRIRKQQIKEEIKNGNI